MKNKIDIVQIILTAIFVIVVMVVTLAVSEDENPFGSAKPPPTSGRAPEHSARIGGIQKPIERVVNAPSK